MWESHSTEAAEPTVESTTPINYAAPVVVDGGEVKAVTLGRNGADRQDRTEYYEK